MRPPTARQAARIVAITLTLDFLYANVSQMQQWAAVLSGHWTIALLLTLKLLFAVPLLASFWILGTTDATLLVSIRRRYLALITASAEVLLLAIPHTYRLLKVVQSHPGFGWYDTGTVAEQLWRWLKNPWVASQLARIPEIVGELAIALFLVTLFRQKNATELIDQPARQLARRFAVAASFIFTLPFALGILRLAYSMAMTHAGYANAFWVETEPATQFISQLTRAQLANLCFAASTWIVYRCLEYPPAKVPSLANPKKSSDPQRSPLRIS